MWNNLNYWGHPKSAAAEILLTRVSILVCLTCISPFFEADVIIKNPLCTQQKTFQQEKRQNVTHLFVCFPIAPFQWQKVGEHVCLVAYCQTQGNASLHFDAGG